MNQDAAPKAEGAEEAEVAEHVIGIVVWDGPSPAIIGTPSSIKIGVGCSCGCDLSKARLVLRNEAGENIASALANEALDQSGALYCAQLPFNAPGKTGVARFTAACELSNIQPVHADAASEFTLRVAPHPEHRVTIRATFDETGAPIANAELFMNGYITHTDAKGEAHFDVPSGQYECSFRKFGFKVEPANIQVAADLTHELEVSRGETREDIERRLSAMEDHPWG